MLLFLSYVSLQEILKLVISNIRKMEKVIRFHMDLIYSVMFLTDLK